jgi:hypothetical protein
MSTIFAIPAAHAPAQFTTTGADTASRVVVTWKHPLCLEIAVTVEFFHNVAPWSEAQVMQPIMAL